MKSSKVFNYAILALFTGLILSCGGSTVAPTSSNLEGYSMSKLDGSTSSVATKKDGAGILIERGYVSNGSKTGQWTTFNEDGSINSIVNFIDGRKNGEELVFSKRMQVETRASYINGNLDGVYGLYKNGRPTKEVSYINGQFDGPTKVYFKNGKLQQEINFKNGKQHGTMQYFNENGDVTVEYEYNNGEKVSGGIVEK